MLQTGADVTAPFPCPFSISRCSVFCPWLCLEAWRGRLKHPTLRSIHTKSQTTQRQQKHCATTREKHKITPKSCGAAGNSALSQKTLDGDRSEAEQWVETGENRAKATCAQESGVVQRPLRHRFVAGWARFCTIRSATPPPTRRMPKHTHRRPESHAAGMRSESAPKSNSRRCRQTALTPFCNHKHAKNHALTCRRC